MYQMETVLYHRRKDGRVKIWMVRLDGDTVTQSWGTHEKKIQTTKHKVKANDRDTAEARARQRYDRLIEMRERKGYVRELNKVVETVMVDDDGFDFDNLPRHFAPAKPIKQADLATLQKWDDQGLLSVQRKRDGMRHRIVSGNFGTIRIYSSSNEDVTEALEGLLGGLRLPRRTIIDAELVVEMPDGSDSFKKVSEIARSHAPKASQKIARAIKEGCDVRFMAFDLLYDAGKPTYKLAYEIRRGTLGSLLGSAYRSSRGGVYTVPEQKSLASAIVNVKTLGWEGLVVWRKDQATHVRVNGSPARVNCWKVKFVKEEDVVATGYRLGKGKNHNVVGNFTLTHRGKPMGNCGGGLDDETRAAALRWKYPCVIQIEYDSKTEKGFRFPTFIRKRDDKKVAEC